MNLRQFFAGLLALASLHAGAALVPDYQGFDHSRADPNGFDRSRTVVAAATFDDYLRRLQQEGMRHAVLKGSGGLAGGAAAGGPVTLADGTCNASISLAFTSDATAFGWYRSAANQWTLCDGGTPQGDISLIRQGGIRMASTGGISITSGASTVAADVFWVRDAAGVWASRNGTNAQKLIVQNTRTDASNGEWGAFDWITTANTLKIGAAANGTGILRSVAFTGADYVWSLSGVNVWAINSSGHLTPTANNVRDAGASATVIRDLYLNGNAGGNAAIGAVGEYLSATAAAGAVALTTNTTATVTSQSLTAGDWDCTGVVNLTFNAATSYTNLAGGTSTTAATLGTQDTTFDFETPAAVPTAGKVMSWVVPVNRFSISSTTTVYLVAQATFTVNTLAAGGTLRCRRVR